jgi:hypothetical protein
MRLSKKFILVKRILFPKQYPSCYSRPTQALIRTFLSTASRLDPETRIQASVHQQALKDAKILIIQKSVGKICDLILQKERMNSPESLGLWCHTCLDRPQEPGVFLVFQKSKIK